MKKVTLLTVLAVLLGGTYTLAQQSSGGYFSGLGRALVTNQSIVDTTSADKGNTTGGYTLFDLGVNAVRNDILKASAILRVRNEFGGFFGDGVSFEFREIRMEGVIGNAVKYELGDLDVALTPYTIHNFNPDFNEYESELFSIKRDIVDYENFYTDQNTWRMQGGNFFSTLKFTNGIEKLGIRIFGNRIETADNGTGTPDRFVYGSRLDITQSEFARVGLNAMSTQDIGGTVSEASVEYTNAVYTADFNFVLDQETIKLDLNGEVGTSMLEMTKSSPDTTVSVDDGFFDVGVTATYKPLNAELRVGYRQVGQYFNSPTAQTRRIYDAADATSFTTYAGNVDGLTRTAILFDRYGQETGLYNSKGISTTLMGFNPIYNNVTPFGVATPNRQGLTLDLNIEDEDKLYDAHVKAELLGEVVGENTSETRSFTAIQLGGRFFLNKLLDIEKTMMIQVGYRSENTERGGVPVSLSTSMIDLAVDVELIPRLHFLGGLKTLTAEGNEYVLTRNEFNTVNDDSVPTAISQFDVNDQVIATGIRYAFSERSSFSAFGQFVTYKNEIEGAANVEYDLIQFYLLYQIKF